MWGGALSPALKSLPDCLLHYATLLSVLIYYIHSLIGYLYLCQEQHRIIESTMMPRIADIAAVSQGMPAFGGRPGMLPGDETLQMVESGDLRDACWVDLDGLKEIKVHHSATIERHRLQPYDVLVTARAGYIQASLVPRGVSRTVASVTLLVVRAS